MCGLHSFKVSNALGVHVKARVSAACLLVIAMESGWCTQWLGKVWSDAAATILAEAAVSLVP